MWFEIVAIALIGLLLYLLLVSKTAPPEYWKEHGSKVINSSVVASNFDILLGRKSIMHRDDYAYQLMGSSDKFCGMMETPSPVILVNDLELIKKIMIKDFDHFVDRRDFFYIADTEHNILMHTLPMQKGNKWRGVRTSMSSTFTTGKIRMMMEHFNDVSQEWVKMLKNRSGSGGSTTIDVVKTVTFYTVEVIATAVFGIRSGAMENPDAIFFKMATRLSNLGFIDFLKLSISPRYPKVLTSLGIEVLDMDAIHFLENLLRQSLDARLNGSVERNDFQQLLLEARKGKVKVVGSDELSSFEKEAHLGTDEDKSRYLTNNMIVANSIVFFLAGLQTTTAFIAMATYVLAVHPDIQDKLRAEVDGIVKEDGSIDYDDLNQSPFMEMFTSEILRCYPAATRLEREAAKDYHDPESGLFVPKGTIVAVPIKSIHYDPKYYPNPERFDPENFSTERKAERSPYAYMPFGIGPRNCIGMRFGLVESKSAIAHLVHSFKIEPTERTPLPVQTVAAGLLLFPPKDLEVKLTKL